MDKRPISDNMKKFEWYAPHLSYLHSQGFSVESDFGDASPIRAELMGVVFDNEDLSWADLRLASFHGCHFNHCNLCGADLMKADLTDSVLEDNVLLVSYFKHSNVTVEQLKKADLVSIKHNFWNFITKFPDVSTEAQKPDFDAYRSRRKVRGLNSKAVDSLPSLAWLYSVHVGDPSPLSAITREWIDEYFQELKRITEEFEEVRKTQVIVNKLDKEIDLSIKTFIHYETPAHSYLAVKKKYLQSLQIMTEITPYSREKGETVYLEEDQDLPVFFKAYIKRYGREPRVDFRYDDRGRIHSFGPFDPYTAK